MVTERETPVCKTDLKTLADELIDLMPDYDYTIFAGVLFYERLRRVPSLKVNSETFPPTPPGIFFYEGIKVVRTDWLPQEKWEILRKKKAPADLPVNLDNNPFGCTYWDTDKLL